MKKSESDIPYALFHVNRRTGEKVRFPRDTFPSDSKSVLDARAQRSRDSVGLTNAFPNDWETRALPDVGDNVKFMDPKMADDTALTIWLATHGAGENMVTLVTYASTAAELVQPGKQAQLSDGRVVFVGQESPNQGQPGNRYILVLPPGA